MRVHRLLTLGLADEPLWVGLHVNQIDKVWVAMLVADGVTSPAPAELKGLAFFAETVEEAKQAAGCTWGRMNQALIRFSDRASVPKEEGNAI
jgi:hypothetical protein